MHNVRTGDKVFEIDILDIKADAGEIETTVFKILQTNLVIDELIEKLIQGVLDEGLDWVESRQLLYHTVEYISEHFSVLLLSF